LNKCFSIITVVCSAFKIWFHFNLFILQEAWNLLNICHFANFIVYSLE
jgi:hypothetical protein